MISVMRNINPKCDNKDSFKCSILTSLHYYDINNHAEKISKLQSLLNNYKITQNTPHEFEQDNPNISLTVYDEMNDVLYTPHNNTKNKAIIVKINPYRYAAIKPVKNNYIKLKELIASHYSHKELYDDFMQIIKSKIIY